MVSRSSSRSRSRSPGLEQAAHDVLSFGRHQGETYRDVLRRAPEYCRWAVRVRNPSGPLRHFARWCRRQQQGQHAPDLSDDDSSESYDGSMPAGMWQQQHADWARSDWAWPQHVAGRSHRSSEAPWDYGSWDASSWRRNSGHPWGEGPADAARLSDSDTAAPPPQAQHVAREAHEVLDLLPRVAFDPQLFDGNPHPDSCPVCMEDFGEGQQIILTPCLHVFHLQCLQGWLTKKKECPSCRWDVTDTGENKAFCSSHAAEPATVWPDASAVFAPGQAIELSDDEG